MTFLSPPFFPLHLGCGGYAYYVTLFVLLKQSKSFFLSNITVTVISLLVRRYLRSFNYVMAHKKRKNERTKKNNIYNNERNNGLPSFLLHHHFEFPWGCQGSKSMNLRAKYLVKLGSTICSFWIDKSNMPLYCNNFPRNNHHSD